MKTHQSIATTFRQAMKRQRVQQNHLIRDAGVASRTLQLMLSGEHDFKMSSFFAVAGCLGLEMVLVPKEFAAAVQAGPTTPGEPVVLTAVQAALNEINERLARNAD